MGDQNNRCHGGDLLATRVKSLEGRMDSIEKSVEETSRCLTVLTTIQEQNSKREDRQAEFLRNLAVGLLVTVGGAAILFVLGLQN